MKINRTGIFPSKTLIGNYVQWCKRSCTYKTKTENRTRLKNDTTLPQLVAWALIKQDNQES